MDDHICPNCRGTRQTDDSPCPLCGWMPLRSTELMFIDNEKNVCPHCSRPRSDFNQACPHCGRTGNLESLSHHTVNFHISSLLLLTTLVAICFALTRISLWIGIPAFLVTGLSLLRTVLLICERKRHRYPVSAPDLMRLFLWNFFGMIVALFVFVLALIGVQFLIIVIVSALMPLPRYATSASTALVVALNQAPAVFMVVRRCRNRGMLFIGTVVAGAVATAMYGLEESGLHDGAMLWSALAVFAGMAAVPIALASRRGGTPIAKSYIIGWSLSCSVLLILLITLQLPGGAEDGLAVIGFSSVLLWPVLFSIATLEQLWSWDDAFPAVISQTHHRPEPTVPRLRSPVVIENEDGIEFFQRPPESIK